MKGHNRNSDLQTATDDAHLVGKVEEIASASPTRFHNFDTNVDGNKTEPNASAATFLFMAGRINKPNNNFCLFYYYLHGMKALLPPSHYLGLRTGNNTLSFRSRGSGSLPLSIFRATFRQMRHFIVNHCEALCERTSPHCVRIECGLEILPATPSLTLGRKFVCRLTFGDGKI